MRHIVIFGALLFSFITFGEIHVSGDTAVIRHDGETYRLMLSELSSAEEARMFGGKYPDFGMKSYAPSESRAIDLRNSMSEVKNQGQRGSCSAFAAMGLVEAYFDKNVDYSEQCLILTDNQEDSGNTFERLTFTRIHIAWNWELERHCLYQDPAKFDEWLGASDERKSELVIRARNMRVTTPRTPGWFDWLDDLVLRKPYFEIVSSDFDNFSSSELIEYIREKLMAGRAVGVALFIPGNGWETGMIDKIPTEKEIEENCVKEKLDDHLKKKCGSHAIIITGFDDEKRLFFFKNSWGPAWGLTEKYQKPNENEIGIGYGALSYEYFARFGHNQVITLKKR